jgi:hypothetical protein
MGRKRKRGPLRMILTYAAPAVFQALVSLIPLL